MKNLNYSIHVENIKADEYFSQEEKKLFLEIPHKVINRGKINVIDFNVPQNDKYSLLNNINIINVKENLTEAEMAYPEYTKLLDDTNYCKDMTGLFIPSKRGYYLGEFIQQLYNHNKDKSLALWNEYLLECSNHKDIKKLSDSFIAQQQLIKEYLVKENLSIPNFHLDYEKLSKEFKNLDYDTRDKEISKLEKTYGTQPDFPQYYDPVIQTNYTAMILDGDYFIHDSLFSDLYIVKNVGESQKFYMISTYKNSFKDNSPYFSSFIRDTKQYYIFLKDNLTDINLIGEVKDGKIIKSSVEIKAMSLMQNHIFHDLVKKSKIVNYIPNFSFTELLQNYTMQNGFYYNNIEERSIVPLLNDLIVVDDKITYKNFKLQIKETEIKHENIVNITIENLLNANKNIKTQSRIYNSPNLDKLAHLPMDFKKQIKDYFNDLIERDNSENAKQLVNLINKHLDKTNIKTLKP